MDCRFRVRVALCCAAGPSHTEQAIFGLPWKDVERAGWVTIKSIFAGYLFSTLLYLTTEERKSG